MNKSVKDMLKAGLVLFLIAGVCVGLLAVANVFLKVEEPPPVLDLDTAQKLAAVCPTGAADENALDYFEIFDVKGAGVDLDAFNLDESGMVRSAFHRADNQTPKDRVLEVYRATKGENAGSLVIKAQAEGFEGGYVVMITAYRPGPVLLKTRVFSNEKQSFLRRITEEELDAFYAGKQVSALDGKFTHSGVSYSAGAIDKALRMSNTLIGRLEAQGGRRA
ncbi:MAG: hypothetical protein LBH24_03545 [Clostridiales bacterium]|jgi:Na+-translocating ferredoxin:NAD+ oxidoreductase RnfG subunit|nr:hypothetical protein [Clostridiales bacterium]